MAADDGRYEKKGDGTHYFSCYLRWYDTVTTTQPAFDGMLPCMNLLATRSIFESFVAPKTANGTLERTPVSLEMPLRHCESHEANGIDNVSETIGHALHREETHGDSSGHIYL